MPTINFFDLLDRMFKGIVYFFYNLVSTTAAVLARPVRGPIRLQRAADDPGRQQIAGLTFLFIGFFLLQLIVMAGIDATDSQLVAAAAGDRIFDAVASAASFDGRILWPAIAAGLCSTIILDALFRFALWRRWPARPRWRHAVLAMFEYALVLPVLAYLVSVGMAALFIREILFGEMAGWLWLAGSAALLLTALVPAARILLAGFRRRPAARARPRLVMAMVTTGTAALFTAATWTGTGLGRGIEERRTAASASASAVRLTMIRCTVGRDGRIEVIASAAQGGGSPNVLEIDRLQLRYGAFGTTDWSTVGGLPVVQQQPEQLPYLLVAPGQPQLLALHATPDGTVPRDAHCALTGAESPIPIRHE